MKYERRGTPISKKIGKTHKEIMKLILPNKGKNGVSLTLKQAEKFIELAGLEKTLMKKLLDEK